MDNLVERRFFDKVRKTPNCWIWIGGSRGKYGSLKVNGKVIDAHRVSYEIHNKIPPGSFLVCHTCDNPLCVNPKHLFLGTYLDNTMDAIHKKRHIIPQGIKFRKGDRPINSTLSIVQATEIKQQIKNRGSKTLKQLSKELDIKEQVLRDISSGRTYKGA
jgi:hypothetical protein